MSYGLLSVMYESAVGSSRETQTHLLECVCPFNAGFDRGPLIKPAFNDFHVQERLNLTYWSMCACACIEVHLCPHTIFSPNWMVEGGFHLHTRRRCLNIMWHVRIAA